MQKVIVIGIGAGNNVIKALTEKCRSVVVVDSVITPLIKNDYDNILKQAFLVEDSDRHMKSSPYPAKKRGKGKFNKY